MALKEFKKPEKVEEEAKAAEELIKAPPPFAVPVSVKLTPEEEKLSLEMDKAYDSVADLAEYSKKLDEKLPVDVNYESKKMLGDLEKSKLKEKEVMGKLRYEDETADIENTIKSAQKAEEQGKHDNAVKLIKSAKAKMELLGEIVEIQRNLAVVGAPSEIIDSVERAYVFLSKGEDERKNLVMQSANLYLQFSDVFKTNKSYSETLTLYISQVSGEKKIDIGKSKEYFDYISTETAKLANRQALENKVKSSELSEQITYINQNSSGEFKKQTGELLNKLDDVSKRLSDKKTMGGVTDEELKIIYQSAALALDGYAIIDSVGDEYKQTQKNLSTIYGNALNASMDGETKQAELHVFSAQEYLINSGNEKYRNGIVSASNKLAEGKLSTEEVYLKFYGSLTKSAQTAAKKDEELGKFVDSLKPPEKIKPKEMEISSLVAIRQALIFSDYAGKNIDKVDEKAAKQFLSRGYSVLKQGNLDIASAQLQLFSYYVNTGYKDGIEGISKIMQKEPEKGIQLAGQFIFLTEMNTGLSGAFQSSGGRTKEIVEDSIAYNDAMMKSVLDGNVLTEQEQVAAYAVSQITFTMAKTTAEMSGPAAEVALGIFENSISAAKEGKLDEAMVLAQSAVTAGSPEAEKDMNVIEQTSNEVINNEISVQDASFIDGIYQSKAENLSVLNKKISYIESLGTKKDAAEEKLKKEKDPVKKKQLQAQIKSLEDKITENAAYLKYLKSVHKTAEKFYDMAAQFAEKGDYNSASYMTNTAEIYVQAKLMPKEARLSEEGKATVKTAEEIYTAGAKALKENKTLAEVSGKNAEQLGVDLVSAYYNMEGAVLKADSDAVISSAKEKKYSYEKAGHDFVVKASGNAVEVYSQGQENVEKALELKKQGKDKEAAELLEKGQNQMDYAKKLMLVTKQYNYSVMFMVTENKESGRADLVSVMKYYYALANGVALDSAGQILLDKQGNAVALDEQTKNIYEESAKNLFVSGYGSVEGQKSVNQKARKILKGVKNAETLLAETVTPTLGAEQKEWVNEGSKSLKLAKKQAKKGNIKKASQNLAKGSGLQGCTKGYVDSYKYEEYLNNDQQEAYKNAGAKVAGVVTPLLPNMPVADTGESTFLVDTANQLGFTPPGLTTFDGEKYREGFGIAADLLIQNDIKTGNAVLAGINTDMNESIVKQHIENHTKPNQMAADLMKTLSNNTKTLVSLPVPETETTAEKEARLEIDNKMVAEVAPMMQNELDKYALEFLDVIDKWNKVAAGELASEEAINFENSFITSYQSRAKAWELAMGEINGSKEVLQTASSTNLYSKVKGVFKGAAITALNESADTRIEMAAELFSNAGDLDGYFATNGIGFAKKFYDERQKEYGALGDLALFKEEVTGYAATLATQDTELTLWNAGYSLIWEITPEGKETRNIEAFGKVNLDPVADADKIALIKESNNKFSMMRSTIVSSLIGSGGFWSTMFSDKAQTDLVEGCTAAAVNYHSASEAIINGKSASEAAKIMAKGDAWFLEHEYETSPMDVAWAAAKTGAVAMTLGPLGGFWMAYNSYKGLKKKEKETTNEIQKLQKDFQKTESYSRMARMGTSIVSTGVLFALSPVTAGTSALAAAGIMTMESTAGLADFYQTTGGWDYMNQGEKALFVFDVGMTVAMAGLPVGGMIVEEAMLGSMAFNEIVMGTVKVPTSVVVAGKALDWAGKGILAAGTFRGALDAGHIVDAVSAGQMSMAEAAFTFGNMTLPMLQMGLHSFRISKTVKKGGAPEYIYRNKFSQFIEAVTLGTPMDDTFAHHMSKEMLAISEAKYNLSEDNLAQYNTYKAIREDLGLPMAVAEEIDVLNSFVKFNKENPDATFNEYLKPKEMETKAAVSEELPSNVVQFKLPEKEVVAPAEELHDVVELNLPDKVAFGKFEGALEAYGLKGEIDDSKLIGNYIEQKKENPKLNFEEYIGANLEKKELNIEKLVEIGALKPAVAEEAIPMLKAVGAEIVAEGPGAPVKKAPAPAFVEVEGKKILGFAPPEKAVKTMPDAGDLKPLEIILWKKDLKAETITQDVTDYLYKLAKEHKLAVSLQDPDSRTNKMLKNLGKLAAEYPEFGKNLLENISSALNQKTYDPIYSDVFLKFASPIFTEQKGYADYASLRSSKLEPSSLEKIQKAVSEGKFDAKTQELVVDYLFHAFYIGEERKLIETDNVFIDNIISELVKLPEEQQKKLGAVLDSVKEKLTTKVKEAEAKLPGKWERRAYGYDKLDVSVGFNEIKMFDYWFNKKFDDQKINFKVYGKEIAGKSAEAVLYESVKGDTSKFAKWLYQKEVILNELYTFGIKYSAPILDNIVQPTVKKFIKNALKLVRDKVALMEDKIFVDKLISKELQEAVIKKGKLKIDEKIEEPLGTKVALINIDKSFTWLLNATGNVRGEDGLAGSAVGDLGLLIYFEGVSDLNGDYGAVPQKLTNQGDEGIPFIAGEDSYANAEKYVNMLREKIEGIATEMGIEESVFKEYLTKFNAEIIFTDVIYTYDPATETFGVKFQHLDKTGTAVSGEEPMSLAALLSKIEGQDTIGKIKDRAAELRKLGAYKEAQNLEEQAAYLQNYLDDIISKLDKLELPNEVKHIKDAKELKPEEKITEVVLIRNKVEEKQSNALHAMAEINGKGVGHIEENNASPSLYNQMGHPLTDYFSTLWQKAIYEALTEAGLYGAYAEGKVEMYAQGPMAVGLRYDSELVSPKVVANAKEAAVVKYKSYSEIKDAGVVDAAFYSGKNKDFASLEIAKKTAGFNITPEEYVDMKTIVGALWLDPEGFLEGKFAEPTPENVKYTSALLNIKEGAKSVRTPEDMITYLHSIHVKDPAEIKKIFTELGVAWGKEVLPPGETPVTPPKPKKMPPAPEAPKMTKPAEIHAEVDATKLLENNKELETALQDAKEGEVINFFDKFAEIKDPAERVALMEYCNKNAGLDHVFGVVRDLNSLIENGDIIAEAYGIPKEELIKTYKDGIEKTMTLYPEYVGRLSILEKLIPGITESVKYVESSKSILFDILPKSKEVLGGKIKGVKFFEGATGAQEITLITDAGEKKFYLKLQDGSPEKQGASILNESGSVAPEVMLEGSFLTFKRTPAGKRYRSSEKYYISKNILETGDITAGCPFSKINEPENAELKKYVLQNLDTVKKLYGKDFIISIVTGLMDRHGMNVWFLKSESKGYTFGNIDNDSAAYYAMEISEDGKPLLGMDILSPSEKVIKRFMELEGSKMSFDEYKEAFFAEDSPFMEGVMEWLDQHQNNEEYKNAIVKQFSEYEGEVGIAHGLESDEETSLKQGKPILVGKFAGESGSFFVNIENARKKFIPEAYRLLTEKPISVADLNKMVEDTPYHISPLKPGEKAETTIKIDEKEFKVEPAKGEPPEGAIVAKRIGENIITEQKDAPAYLESLGINTLKTGAKGCFESLINLPKEEWPLLLQQAKEMIIDVQWEVPKAEAAAPVMKKAPEVMKEPGEAVFGEGWKQLTDAETVQYSEQMFDLFMKSYGELGLEYENPKELIERFPIKYVSLDKDGNVTAFVTFSETNAGKRMGLCAAPESAEGKAMLKAVLKDIGNIDGWYGAVSGRPARIAIIEGEASVVPFKKAQQLMGKPKGAKFSSAQQKIGKIKKMEGYAESPIVMEAAKRTGKKPEELAFSDLVDQAVVKGEIPDTPEAKENCYAIVQTIGGKKSVVMKVMIGKPNI